MSMTQLKYMAAAAMMAMAISSCDEETTTIGESLTNDNDRLNTIAASFPVTTQTIMVDSVYSMSGDCFLGRVRDPETGAVVESDFTTQFHVFESTFISPESRIVKRGADGRASADSCQLILYLSSPFRKADSLFAMKMSITELQRPMEEGVRYYSNFSPLTAGLLRQDGGLKKDKVFSYENTTDTDSARSSSKYLDNISISLKQPYTDRNGHTYDSYGTYLLHQYFDNKDSFTNNYLFAHEICPGFFFHITDGLGFHAKVSDIGLRTFYTVQTDTGRIDAVLTLAATNEVLRATHVSNDRKVVEQMCAEKEYTYLKTPAGLFTEVTLPVVDIKKGHENDSLLAAEVTFTRLNNGSSDSRLLNIPQSLLMVEKDSLHNFFEQNRVPDNKTSYYTSFVSKYNYYHFTNISSLVTTLWNQREKGLKSNPNWVAEHPNWNKVVLVPITYTTTSSSSTTISSVHHDMSLTSTRLVGGPNNQHEPVMMKIVYAKFNE